MIEQETILPTGRHSADLRVSPNYRLKVRLAAIERPKPIRDFTQRLLNTTLAGLIIIEISVQPNNRDQCAAEQCGYAIWREYSHCSSKYATSRTPASKDRLVQISPDQVWCEIKFAPRLTSQRC